ncbi:uncharacterized protein LOC122387705 [Amphibalanus amphitrite]|uniref:uncharacterized protein LOC122365353 n=1 Tax=Amphibalanus amphitrite TaxID=1232801 RepID=UPI001C909415|nr:uncharacterized protein LOC122365353 [Amphibalanus amphitrite]XP_043234049.1 uncharacterized protein LOC122387705 [Amphibalanus amphitrite]
MMKYAVLAALMTLTAGRPEPAADLDTQPSLVHKSVDLGVGPFRLYSGVYPPGYGYGAGYRYGAGYGYGYQSPAYQTDYQYGPYPFRYGIHKVLPGLRFRKEIF